MYRVIKIEETEVEQFRTRREATREVESLENRDEIHYCGDTKPPKYRVEKVS